MERSSLVLLLFAILCCFEVIHGSPGDADPVYRGCVEHCEMTGCNFSLDGDLVNDAKLLQEPLYLRWKQWDCRSNCRYECMHSREEERQQLGYKPNKYHGKWPFIRSLGVQEPASVLFSAFNLAMHFHGWVSFFCVEKKKYYEYNGLWNIYALFSMNSWFWSAAFHTRDVELTERLDYSSAVAFLGYSLFLAIIRVYSVRVEAARVMVAAPVFAFVTTHILYLNFFRFDYGWNMKVCVAMGILQMILWSVWAGITRHPSRWKLWVVIFGGALAMLLEIYDFPPYWGYIDAHALWHATTIPLTYLWWSFARDDCKFRASVLSKKVK